MRRPQPGHIVHYGCIERRGFGFAMETNISPRAAFVIAVDGLTVDLQVFYRTGAVELERGIHYSPELAHDRWTWIEEEDNAHSLEEPEPELRVR